MALQNWIYNGGVSVDTLTSNEYTEYKDSGKESYSPGQATANRSFLVGWDFRPQFLDDLLGWSYLDSNNAVKRILPDEHPEIDNFFAEDATLEGIGVLGASDNNTISWTTAKVNTNYKPRDYAVKADYLVSSELDRYTTKTYAFSADYLTINGQMKFNTPAGKGQVLQSPPGRITTAMELSYVWHQVPAKNTNPFIIPNLNAINACIGCLNCKPFDPNGGNYSEGTVLFVGVDPKMVTGKKNGSTATNPVGNYFWEITFKFLYRNNGAGAVGSSCGGSPATGCLEIGQMPEYAGHNYIYNIQQGIWDLVTSDGTFCGQRIYGYADLNSLWSIS